MTTKKCFVGLCLLYCFSLPSSSVSGQKNPRSKRIRNITNTPWIFSGRKETEINLKEIAYANYLPAERRRQAVADP